MIMFLLFFASFSVCFSIFRIINSNKNKILIWFVSSVSKTKEQIAKDYELSKNDYLVQFFKKKHWKIANKKFINRSYMSENKTSKYIGIEWAPCRT